MLFLLAVVVLFIIFMFVLYRNSEKPRKYSKGILVFLIFSIIVNTSLAQNYTASLIPGNEGIGISNVLAYWIITDDYFGSHWSQDLFKSFYDYSTLTSILTLALYSILILREKN